MFKHLRNDIKMVFERDPAARGFWEIVLFYPGLHAIWAHRVSHLLWERGIRFPSRFLAFLTRFFTGIEIHPGAKIGRGFFIDHGAGVVIGETAEIGENVTIYQGVILGGVSLKKEKRHPTLRNNVVIGAGAIVLGPVEIGEGCKIGAGSVVLNDIAPFTTAVGLPARPAGRHEPQSDVDLDHNLIPDPVKSALDGLKERIEQLENKLGEEPRPRIMPLAGLDR